MSTNIDIDEIIELEEASAANIKQLAGEVGLSTSKLESGATRQEEKVDRQKAALVTGVEKDGGERSKAETLAALMRQNQANLSRVAEAAGVPSRKISGGRSASSTDREKEALFGLAGEERGGE